MKQITWFIFPEWKYQNLGTMQTLQDNQHFPVSIFEIVERCTYIISANSS